MRALTCLTSPTVNSYRRLWDTGFWAPVFADWGFQNRTTALRVSAPGRFEYRSVDSAVNPHLSFAGLLQAMDDGLDRSLDPGQPEERNIYEAMEAGKEVQKIPLTLGEALEALRSDDVIMRSLPGEMSRVFFHYKTDEWERFLAHRLGLGHRGVPRRPALTAWAPGGPNQNDQAPRSGEASQTQPTPSKAPCNGASQETTPAKGVATCAA